MKFARIVDIYMFQTQYQFGLFNFKIDCFIVFALKAMLNAAGNGYQGHPMRNVRTGLTRPETMI